MAAGAVIPWDAEHIGSYTLPVIGAIALAVFAVGMSVAEFPRHTVVAALFLPVALFLYIPLVALLVPAVHATVYVMAAGAFALLVLAARPGVPVLNRLDAPVGRHATHHS
jgi:hypothetical protein